MSKDFFPSRSQSRPTIYAYEDTNPQYAGLLKVGCTTSQVRAAIAAVRTGQLNNDTLRRVERSTT